MIDAFLTNGASYGHMIPGIDYIGIAVTFACQDGKGNFLMHKRSKNARDEKERWDFGGGKLEHGEEILDGLRREGLEEFGCKMQICEALPPRSVFREINGAKSHWLLFSFITQANPADACLNEPESMDQIGWFKLDNLPQPLHSGILPLIEYHKAYFDKYKK